MTFQFEIMGKPASKGRPRFSTYGNFVKTYTPPKTVEYENLVRMSFIQSGGKKMEGNITAQIFAIFPIPKSVSKKKREAMMHAPYDKKPDCDNIAKIVLDALNGIAYDDDSQIVSLTVRKWYSDEPKTVVLLFDEGGADNEE